mgnify:CR=1 FL=1
MNRLAFTGTRHGMDGDQRRQFANFLCDHLVTEFHYGGCIGADDDAFKLWAAHGGHLTGVAHCWPALVDPSLQALPDDEDIELYGIVMHEPMAPLERNRQMVNHSDIVFAAPHATKPSRGTRFTINYAQAVDVPTVVVS